MIRTGVETEGGVPGLLEYSYGFEYICRGVAMGLGVSPYTSII